MQGKLCNWKIGASHVLFVWAHQKKGGLSPVSPAHPDVRLRTGAGGTRLGARMTRRVHGLQGALSNVMFRSRFTRAQSTSIHDDYAAFFFPSTCLRYCPV
jgi:hypothetical protein